MSGSVQEVGPPSERGGSPEHTMSPEGAARLAALNAGVTTHAPEALEDQSAPAFKLSEAGAKLREEMEKARPELAAKRANQNHPGAKDFDTTPRAQTPTAQGGDGETVDLESGEVTPSPTADLEGAVVPDLAILPQTVHEEARQYAVEMEAIAQVHGIPPERAQRAFDAIADLYAANDADLTVSTKEQATQVMATRYGIEASAKLIEDAQIQTNYYGPDFKAWLDATGAGNSPAVLFLLAQAKRGELRYTPDEAAKKLSELGASGTFDKATIDLRRVLTRLAQGAKPKEQKQDYFAVSPSRDPFSLSHLSASDLRKELDAMQTDLTSDLYSADGIKRGKAIKRRQALQAQLAGKA